MSEHQLFSQEPLWSSMDEETPARNSGYVREDMFDGREAKSDRREKMEDETEKENYQRPKTKDGREKKADQILKKKEGGENKED